MKIHLYYLLAYLPLYISCSTQAIRTTTINSKAQISISTPTKAAIFIQNKKIESNEEYIKNHISIANSIYNQFGGATNKFYIGRTNALTIKFSTDSSNNWLVNVDNLKKGAALILYDGKNKPIVEYNPLKYQTLINKKFPKEIEQIRKRNNAIPINKKSNTEIIDSIWAIPFTPDSNYAHQLIHNSNTHYYPLPPFRDDIQTDGILHITSYSDLNRNTIKYETEIEHKNNQLIKNSYKSEKYNHIIIFHRDTNGLIDSITNHAEGNKPNVMIFKYLPNSFIYTTKGEDTRTEINLNNLKQVVSSKMIVGSKSPFSENLYVHDAQNRTIREEEYREGKLTLYREYTYNSLNSNKFTTQRSFDNKGYMTSEMNRTYYNGVEHYTIYNNGVKVFEIIYKLDKMGEGEAIMKNEKGEVVSIDKYKKVKK